MPRRAAAPAAGCVALLLGLAACGPDTQRTFGFTRDAPDEFQVTTRAPLSMPPALGDLPVPRPGAPRPQEQSARIAAESALVPGAALGQGASARRSGGESALLTQAGRPVNDDVRRQVDAESLKLEAADRSFTDKLIFWREPEPPGTPVDAQREAQRLRENAALGRDATDGDTPVVARPRSQNPIQRLWESIF